MPQPSWQVGQALLSVTALALLLGLAIASDLRAHRIPNRLVGLGLAAALMLHAWSLAAGTVPLAGTHWWSPLAGAAVGAALLLPLHLAGGMGAGDVKLMAMAGAFVGARSAAWAALYALVLGGMACAVAALWSMAHRRRAMQTLHPLHPLDPRDSLDPLHQAQLVSPYAPGPAPQSQSRHSTACALPTALDAGSRRAGQTLLKADKQAQPTQSQAQTKPARGPGRRPQVAGVPARSGFRRVPYAPVLALGIVLAGWRSWSAVS